MMCSASYNRQNKNFVFVVVIIAVMCMSDRCVTLWTPYVCHYNRCSKCIVNRVRDSQEALQISALHSGKRQDGHEVQAIFTRLLRYPTHPYSPPSPIFTLEFHLAFCDGRLFGVKHVQKRSCPFSLSGVHEKSITADYLRSLKNHSSNYATSSTANNWLLTKLDGLKTATGQVKGNSTSEIFS